MGARVELKKCYHEAEGSEKKGKMNVFSLDVNFEMKNELVVLFGPSGSGKTTLLKCISGITQPDSGNISVDDRIYFDSGRKINLPIQKRNLGFVFQTYTLFPHMNIRKNIECGLKGWEKGNKEKRVREMLDLLHIEELETRYPSQLSGGQKQRVALARALAPKPELLLLDEPFSALDRVIRTELAEKIKHLQKKIGIPLLFITHSLDEAFLLADRILILYRGEVQQFGTPEEIFYNPKNMHVAELVGMSNIFSDAWVEEQVEGHNAGPKCTVLKSGGMRITVKPLSLKEGDKVSWGIHPENITLLLPDSGSEDQDENIYPAYVHSIISKGPKKRIVLKLTKHEKSLTAELPAQFADALNLNTGDLCLVKMDMSKVVAF
ncbi:ABC transporter ATP-binding protein [Methanosarcina sp. 1.H.T.1A.1]|uniref:ABC transporter ATP-binding protein n=1 Tax=Methanosarcina sp. 1.H.T.1A.1 TaxID=1483602 RepID=UPI000A9E8149|nr:ABC transporter ATP-binding protein [Methanosarcina sp. 1.H.T.1A.1]